MKQIFILFIGLFFSCTSFNSIEGDHLLPETADKDSSLPSLVLNGCTFHLRTYGNSDNPTIIFLHGGADDFKGFQNFIEKEENHYLTDNYHIVLYDQRGKGLSQRFNSKDDITFEIYKEDLKGIADYYSPEKKVIIFAYSFGGIIAGNYINTYPERVGGVILIEPGALNYQYREDSNPTDLSREWVNDLMWSQQIVGASNHIEADLNFASMMLSDDFNVDGDSNEVTPFWRIGTAAQTWLTMEQMSTNYDFSSNLYKLDGEVLIITGSDSNKLGTQCQKNAIKYFKNPKLIEIPGANHSSLLESHSFLVTPLIEEYLGALKESEGGENE